MSDAATLLARADELGRISEEPGRLTRRFATPALSAACELVGDWMAGAGLTVTRDAVGNVIGRSGAADAPALVLGSHLDTVPDAGRYDGALGVLAGIAVAERLHGDGTRLPHPLEIVGFADEEGARFGIPYLGSAAYTGTFDESWLEACDEDGTTLRAALAGNGGDPDGLAAAARPPGSIHAYVEAHIEQGPVLDEAGEALAVATAIAGQTRVELSFRGAAAHAGTTPAGLRRDALAGAAEVVLAAEAAGRSGRGVLATVGRLEVGPGAGNVVPGATTLSLDVRHADDAVRQAQVEALRAAAERAAGARGLELEWALLLDQPAVPLDAGLTDRLAAAAGEPRRLVSGAGHDAAVVARVAPAALLFVRCAGGVSHSPAESVLEGDVAAALDALTTLARRELTV